MQNVRNLEVSTVISLPLPPVSQIFQRILVLNSSRDAATISGGRCNKGFLKFYMEALFFFFLLLNCFIESPRMKLLSSMMPKRFPFVFLGFLNPSLVHAPLMFMRPLGNYGAMFVLKLFHACENKRLCIAT